MTNQWAETKRQRRFNWQAALVIVVLLTAAILEARWLWSMDWSFLADWARWR
jgi:uncharacterized membrane protein SpoIIM required for sporulation